MNKLSQLSVDHPYSCGTNWTNKYNHQWDNMSDFLDEFEDADVDMNLIYRWDIIPEVDNHEKKTGKYYAEVFMIMQRKGYLVSHEIGSVTEEEANRFQDLAKIHWGKIREIWEPLSKNHE